MQSLLGLFYSRIKGSQEDIASEGLTYILQQSLAARQALSRLMKAECGLEFSDLSYITQNIGERLERPDVSGYDVAGKEVLILEAKFWASLTGNQPVQYLNRLGDNSALVFICPNLRRGTLYDELLRRMRAKMISFEEKAEGYALEVEGKKHLLVKTWDEILGTVHQQLVQANEQALLSDLDQIIGLCKTIDSHSFLPLQAKDLSPGIGKRINSFYDLTDKVADELIKRGFANSNGLKTTARKYSYTRYLNIGVFGAALSLKFNYWEKHADTPLWITLKERVDKDWKLTERLIIGSKKVASQLNFRLVENRYRVQSFALFPLLDQTEDVVVSNLVDQVVQITEAIHFKFEDVPQ